jgi:hypothetical protein
MKLTYNPRLKLYLDKNKIKNYTNKNGIYITIRGNVAVLTPFSSGVMVVFPMVERPTERFDTIEKFFLWYEKETNK